MQRILAILALALLFAYPANAVVVSRVTTFESGTPIIADDMNAELDNILSALNGNLSASNLVSGALATANIATAAVTTDKINAGAVTKDKLDTAVSSVTTRGSDVSPFNSEIEVAIANLSTTIITHGRPVFVGFQASGSTAMPGGIRYRSGGIAATTSAAYVSVRRGGATVNMASIAARNVTSPTNNVNITVPCSSFWFLETPASGSQSYVAFARTATNDNGFLTVENCKLVVFEL